MLRPNKHSSYPKVPHGSAAELTAVTDQQHAVLSATQSYPCPHGSCINKGGPAAGQPDSMGRPLKRLSWSIITMDRVVAPVQPHPWPICWQLPPISSSQTTTPATSIILYLMPHTHNSTVLFHLGGGSVRSTGRSFRMEGCKANLHRVSPLVCPHVRPCLLQGPGAQLAESDRPFSSCLAAADIALFPLLHLPG